MQHPYNEVAATAIASLPPLPFLLLPVLFLFWALFPCPTLHSLPLINCTFAAEIPFSTQLKDAHYSVPLDPVHPLTTPTPSRSARSSLRCSSFWGKQIARCGSRARSHSQKKNNSKPQCNFSYACHPWKGVHGEGGEKGKEAGGWPKTTANNQQGKQINADKELQAAEL